jgi:hypothetical protein
MNFGPTKHAAKDSSRPAETPRNRDLNLGSSWWLIRGASLLLLLSGGAPLSGCGDWTGGNGGNSGSWAPQVTSSFPESGIQYLPEASSITFNAAGNDVDSLDLDWEWQLNNALQAFGELDSGEFDESWTLEWSQDLSGALHDVHFVVTDPEGNSTELFWPIQVD